ncbi:Prenylated Rab acceptor protein 1 [Mactra antiquata]
MEKVDLLGDIESPVVEKQNLGLRQRIMALSLSNASAREWLAKARDGIRPWGDFVNTSKFQTPKSVAPIPKRVMKNIEHFQSNYLFVFLGLVVFCILTSPMLLVALAACFGACYIISLKNKDNQLKIMGRELSVAQQYGMVGICSFPLFWLAGAGSAVFWVIGASFFVIMLHASFYIGNEEGEPFDLEMDPV